MIINVTCLLNEFVLSNECLHDFAEVAHGGLLLHALIFRTTWRLAFRQERFVCFIVWFIQNNFSYTKINNFWFLKTTKIISREKKGHNSIFILLSQSHARTVAACSSLRSPSNFEWIPGWYDGLFGARRNRIMAMIRTASQTLTPGSDLCPSGFGSKLPRQERLCGAAWRFSYFFY